MDSIEGTVNAALALKNWTQIQEKDNALLKKVLDNQANTIASLIDSVPTTGPQPLATSGSVGTKIHVTA